MNEYLKNLRDAVTAMHGCACIHQTTSKVIETLDGKVVWQGDVETFDLQKHPQATKAFAWAWYNNSEPNYIAILNIPPINDPSDAVKAAIASGKFQ